MDQTQIALSIGLFTKKLKRVLAEVQLELNWGEHIREKPGCVKEEWDVPY